ncbi:MAG: KH domain-containing protein [Candidatus Nanoarchaeia archaeon]
MYSYELRIPKDRIAILIGKKGTIKRQLEKKTNTKIDVDSDEGRVTISSEEGLNIYSARLVVQAIARGFNPDIARILCDEDYCLEVINIKDYSGKSKKKMARLKSRVIGTKGKAWKNIEKLTHTCISVYGKTVCVIGKIEDVPIAKEALENLLKGAPHGPVYKWIESKKRRARKWT